VTVIYKPAPKVLPLIASIEVTNADVVITFEGGEYLRLVDLPTCCESRYFFTDDDLGKAKGCSLVDITVRDVVQVGERNNYTELEATFILIKTSGGTFVINAYNEHNGAYSGFNVEVEYGQS